ncbi:MAG: ATP-binding protein [bacterium]
MHSRFVLRGIRQKLLFSCSLLLASIALFVVIFFPARLQRQAMRASVAKAEVIRDMAAYSLTAGLIFGDTAAVHEVLSGAANNRGVQSLVVRDSLGRVFATESADSSTPARVAETTAAGAAFVAEDGLTYVTSTDIVHNNVRFGTLAVRISLADLHREVATARQLVTAVGALIFIIGFMVVYAISALVTRPLMAVSDTVKRIAAGNLALRAVETSDAEVTQLVRAFNHMVDSLAGAQADLANINQQLEGRVEARTAELRHAIADQRNAQHALSESESQARSTSEMLQSLIDVAPQAILTTDLDWRVTRWNLAAERLFGWSAPEVLGKPVPFIGDDQRASFRRRQQMVAASSGASTEELLRTRRDGSIVSVLLSTDCLLDKDQRTTGYIGVATDLTERKLLEEQLRQSQKMEAIGQLAGGVAHDFNNILTVITSCASLLLDDERDAEKREDLQQISIAATRAAALTRQLLTFSRKQIVQLQPVDVDFVVRDVEPMLRRLLFENIEFKTRLAGNLPEITADVPQLQQVIMNLVVNASDAMPDGGTLSLTTNGIDVGESDTVAHPGVVPGRYVQLTVSDTGTGMDAATMARIFEPFFTTKEIGRGTGLGLATTYAVVAQLHGHINVFSDVGRGTTFKIYLPFHVIDESLIHSAVPVTDGDFAPTSETTVLLVEDEDSVRRSVRRMLEQRGYTVLEAPNGEAGLALAAGFGGSIDILMTDIMMPGMNGRSLADSLLVARPEIGVVFMSGYTDDSVSQSGLVDETHAFLQKPFTSGQVAVAIQNVQHRRVLAPA